MKPKGKTAAELMAELQADPEFRKRELKAEQKRLLNVQKYAELMGPTLAQLDAGGFRGSSLQEIVRNFAPLPPSAVKILIQALSDVTDARAKEDIVRALAAADSSFEGSPLAECFDQASDEGLKWAILNTVALTRPHSISAWIQALHNTPYGEILVNLS